MLSSIVRGNFWVGTHRARPKRAVRGVADASVSLCAFLYKEVPGTGEIHAASEGSIMTAGLTPRQQIVQIDVQNALSTSIKEQVDGALAVLPLHRIVSLSVTSMQEFSTAATVIVVIEFLEHDGH